MSDLIQLIYVSAATERFSKTELGNLLSHAREANAAHDITGMLLYKDGDFMQVIEGPEQEIEQLHQNIIKDSRHTQVMTLIKEPIDGRHFPKWAMAHRSAPEDTAEGFENFFHSDEAEAAIAAGKAKDLLLSFKNT